MTTSAAPNPEQTSPIVITGAASGIGAAVAAHLTARNIPWIGVDKTAAAANIIECDLADPDAIQALAEQLPDPLAGLANVAGVPGTAPARLVLAVNALAPRLLAHALVDRMEPGAAIVNVASVAAHRNTQPPDAVAALINVVDLDGLDRWLAEHPLEGPAAYDTSKRALVDWTPLQAARTMPRLVRCLSVSPGPVQTPILDDFTQSMGADSMARSVAAVGRHGRPEEIAAVIAFALSPEATWVNGIDIPVEGGLMAARTAAAAAQQTAHQPAQQFAQ